MKVLLVVVAAFVAVNAGPVSIHCNNFFSAYIKYIYFLIFFNKVPASQLKETAESVLDITKTLQSEIETALKVSETVLKTSEKAVEQIPSTVAENEKVAELKVRQAIL